MDQRRLGPGMEISRSLIRTGIFALLLLHMHAITALMKTLLLLLASMLSLAALAKGQYSAVPA